MRLGRAVAAAILITSSATLVAARSAPQKLDGVCGPANGVAVGIAPSSGLCAVGSPSAVTGSGPWFWTCAGQRGGKAASCSAPLLPANPTLHLTVSPPAPSVDPTAPLGTAIAHLSASWSDGSQFTGSFAFSAPYNDDGGAFTVVGSSLLSNQDLSAFSGTTQLVTLIAVQ